MDGRLRIATIRLAEKINHDVKFADKLGISDKSHYLPCKQRTVQNYRGK